MVMFGHAMTYRGVLCRAMLRYYLPCHAMVCFNKLLSSLFWYAMSYVSGVVLGCSVVRCRVSLRAVFSCFAVHCAAW